MIESICHKKTREAKGHTQRAVWVNSCGSISSALDFQTLANKNSHGICLLFNMLLLGQADLGCGMDAVPWLYFQSQIHVFEVHFTHVIN